VNSKFCCTYQLDLTQIIKQMHVQGAIDAEIYITLSGATKDRKSPSPLVLSLLPSPCADASAVCNGRMTAVDNSNGRYKLLPRDGIATFGPMKPRSSESMDSLPIR
jgi:hypothetical protein